MPYATQANLVARFGAAEIQQLSDINNTGAIDATRVAQALTDATSKIDGYLAAQYSLPLATQPPMLEQLCCDMARYLLGARPTEEMRRRYEDALKWLELVAQAKIKLGGDGATEPPSTGGAIGISTGGRVFDSTTLSDWNDPRSGRAGP